MIKMIVTDLDGTLLRKDKTVSDYTASVFRRCNDRGIKVVLATARPIRAVKTLDIKFKHDACVCHNGAVISIGGVIFQKAGIAPKTARTLLRAASRFEGMRIAAEIGDVLYANFDASTVWPGADSILTDFSDFGDMPETPADKIIFITAERNDISEIEKLLGGGLYWEIAENEILMVMNRCARKLNAVFDLAAHFGIPLSETASFGDDYNDVEMLRECGMGVATRNAIAEAKSAARFICPSNDDDGVAKWIEEHVL